MQKAKIIFAAAALLSMSMAFAGSGAMDQGTAYNQHRGPWVEAVVGPNAYYLGIFSSGNIHHGGFFGFGWNANVGYNFTPYIGVEGGYTRNVLKFKNQNASHQYVKTDVDEPYLAARFTIPFAETSAILFKAGVMDASFKAQQADARIHSPAAFIPYTGIGYSYSLNHTVDLTVQYQGAVYMLVSFGVLGAGVTYHF